jgi:hypothetical protein
MLLLGAIINRCRRTRKQNSKEKGGKGVTLIEERKGEKEGKK